MRAYCVILCSQPFSNASTHPRTRSFYVGAPTANTAIASASELNPEFRVVGVEHSDLWPTAYPYPISLIDQSTNALPVS
jgi:hypothetical protein